MKKKGIILTSICVAIVIICITFANRPDKISKDCIILKKKCIMISWSASKEDALSTVNLWQKYKKAESEQSI